MSLGSRVWSESLNLNEMVKNVRLWMPEVQMMLAFDQGLR
jgi:hypothetical protein